jgi:peptide/nickel transport system substrate-binding protein
VRRWSTGAHHMDEGVIRSRRGFALCAVILLSLAIAATLSGCARRTRVLPQTTAQPPAAAGEGDRSEIVVALAQAPTSLDPADVRDRESETVIRNMFDGLVTRDTRSGVHLELAKRLTWLDDQTLQIDLREGVLFHDGVEMTAEDVVYTFGRIIEENALDYPGVHTSPRKSLIAPLESIEQTGSFQVLMHFSSPWPIALQMLVHQQIVPKHYLEAVGGAGFAAHPIGTGPFRFVSADEDLSQVVLERFDDYYGGAPDLPPVGPACVGQVVFLNVPDALTRAAALLVEEVDIIQAVPFDLVALLNSREGLEVLTAPGTRPVWLELNVNNPYFMDAAVRRALNFAIDKERIIEEVYGGQAVALPGPLSPYNEYADPDLAPYPYDPERALSLLAQAGWRDTDGDEVLDKNIRPFAFVIDTLPQWEALGEALASDLGEIGISVAVRTWDRSIIVPQLLAGERAAYLGGWGDSAFDPVGHFEAKWHGFVPGVPYGRGNYSGYNNPRVNQLIRAGEATADPDIRHKIYNQAQEIIYQDAPAVFLILPQQIEAASSRVEGWEPASDGRINLHDVCLIQ